MNILEIKTKTLKCLKILEKNEKVIIQNDINERTIAHKFAEYLQIEFSAFNVDVEYNRNFENGRYEPKQASLIINVFEESYQKAKDTNQDISEFMKQVTTYPDIIIHQRGNNDKNLLIIEIKKDNNKSDWRIDEKKLEAFTRRKEEEGYNYILGMHLTIYIGTEWRKPTYEWYIKGIKE
ncbi:MAG: hypothetical protein WAZ63_12190 [Rhodoferax sp.]|uniref:hypothetical protein n=1 Tax=Rhodoferax sp. TaxID=50421 RepID=UPI003BB7658B